MLESVLLTGANGTIGGWMAGQFQHLGWRVHEHRGRCDGDLAEPGVAESFFHDSKPTIVVHCAALASIQTAQANPLQAIRSNIEATRLMVQSAARSMDRPRFVFVSTDAVFSQCENNSKLRLFVEDDPISPRGVYAQTKAIAESLVKAELPHSMVVRGTYLIWKGREGSGFVSELVRAATEGRPFDAYEDYFSTPLHPSTAAAVIAKLIAHKELGTWHLASFPPISQYDLAKDILAEIGVDSRFIQRHSLREYPRGREYPLSPALSGAKLSSRFDHTLPISQEIARFAEEIQGGGV